MRKIFLFIIPIIIVICIIGFLWFTLSSDVSKAQLIIDYGEVQIRHEGESWTSAQNGVLLYQSDSVKTGYNTSASIVLFESSIIRLDSNTEVTIQKILIQAEKTDVKIKQDVGRTWNTIRNLSGIDNYDVQTPTTVASVRGTSFDINVFFKNLSANISTSVGVGHGTIVISSFKNGKILDTIEAKKNESVTIDSDDIDKPLEVKPFEKDDWVHKNQKKDDEIMRLGDSSYISSMINVKEELYKRIEPYIPELKERYGVTDEELDVLIDGYLLGYYDLPPETPNWIREIIELS